ncbi:tyrosine-protein phosphatase [Nocardia sp. IFM 10818]
MTISRAVRGTLTGVAASLIAVFPATLTPAAAAPSISILPQAPADGDFSLTRAPNAGDIGGVAAFAGTIKNGLVYRTDALDKLTDADQQKLITYGVTKIIDFRSPTERAANPNKVPASIPTQLLPVYDPNNDFYTFIGGIITGGHDKQQEMLGNGKAAQIMKDYYKLFVTDATMRDQFGTALREIAGASGPVLYHCTAGKDRTGWMTAILMNILGTDQFTIFDNFLESNDRLAASNKATLDALEKQGLIKDRSLFEPLLGVQREFLQASFGQAAMSYGSMERFISDGLGIDRATIDTLRDKLIQRPGLPGTN